MKPVDVEEKRKLRDVPKGTYIRKLHRNGEAMKHVYIKGDYDRSMKRYELVRFDDCSLACYCTPDTKVLVGFTF